MDAERCKYLLDFFFILISQYFYYYWLLRAYMQKCIAKKNRNCDDVNVSGKGNEEKIAIAPYRQ
jgi:hypothetical protein